MFKKSDLAWCKWDNYVSNPLCLAKPSLYPLHLFLCVTLSISSNPSQLGCPQNLEPARPWSQAHPQGPDSPADQALSAAWLRTHNPSGPRRGICTQPELKGLLNGKAHAGLGYSVSLEMALS